MQNNTNELSRLQPAPSRAWTGLCLLASITIAAGLTIGCDQGNTRLPDLEEDREEDNCCEGDSCSNEITTVAQLEQCRTVAFTADPSGGEMAEDGEYSEHKRHGHWNRAGEGSDTTYHIELSEDGSSAELIEHIRSLSDDGGDTVLWQLQGGEWKNEHGFKASARCTTPWGDEEPARAPGKNWCGNEQVDGDEFCDASDPDGLMCESLGFTSGTFSCPSDCSKPTLEDSGCFNVPNLYQARYDPADGSFPYDAALFPSAMVTGAPEEIDTERWSVVHDASTLEEHGKFRIYHMAKDKNTTLYRFTWDGEAYAYDYAYAIDFDGLEDELDTTKFAMTHGYNTTITRIWFLNKDHDTLVSFQKSTGFAPFKKFSSAMLIDNEVDTSGVDLSGWAMIDVGNGTAPGGDDSDWNRYFYAWNSNHTEIVEFRLDVSTTDTLSTAEPTGYSYPVTDFPADMIGGDFGMMHNWEGANLGDDHPDRNLGHVRFYVRGSN